MNVHRLINVNRFEALVTETHDEDMNGPATFGVVRLLAAHIDSALALVQTSLIILDDKIDGVEQRLDSKIESKIDGLDQKLSARIDGLDQKLSARIDGVEVWLEARIDGIEQRIDGAEQRLDDKIDGVEQRLESKIDNLGITLRAEMTSNHAIMMDQFAQRANSDRFIKVGFAVAVIGVLFQTAMQLG